MEVHGLPSPPYLLEIALARLVVSFVTRIAFRFAAVLPEFRWQTENVHE